MSIIKQRLPVKSEEKEEGLSVLFESGASRSLVRSEVAKDFTTLRDLLIPVKTVANAHRISYKHYCSLWLKLKVKK